MLEALQKIEGQVHPKKSFDDIVKVLHDWVVGWREGCVEHGGDAGICYEQDDTDIEDGLPFAVGVDDNFLPTILPLLLRLNVVINLILARRRILIVVSIGIVKYFWKCSRSKQCSFPSPLILLICSKFDFPHALLMVLAALHRCLR